MESLRPPVGPKTGKLPKVSVGARMAEFRVAYGISNPSARDVPLRPELLPHAPDGLDDVHHTGNEFPD